MNDLSGFSEKLNISIWFISVPQMEFMKNNSTYEVRLGMLIPVVE